MHLLCLSVTVLQLGTKESLLLIAMTEETRCLNTFSFPVK